MVTTAQVRRVKPIPTWYQGVCFRSRLEARWAVFFDHLGIRWLYEPQGFDIDGRAYLPDFALLLWKTLWAEVKPFTGADANGESRWRAFIASQPKGTRGVLLTDMDQPYPGKQLIIGSQGDGSYWEDDAHQWMQCPDGYHFDVRWDFGRSENDGKCDACTGTALSRPPSAVLWSRSGDPGGSRILLAYGAARSERFGRQVNSG